MSRGFLARARSGACIVLALALVSGPLAADDVNPVDLDAQLAAVLRSAGFTGTIQSQLVPRLGRPLDPRLAALGNALFFDTITGLHDDNTCAGCHAPNAGFGDTQSIAIGIQNNGVVGPQRTGPRNQRRTPTIVNTAFYPKLMWNGRFLAASGDPFDATGGFLFPYPEGRTRFPGGDPAINHLLIAQAHMPPTETTEVAGFTGAFWSLEPRYAQFDDGIGSDLPLPDASGARNDPIRAAVLARLNASPAYRSAFGQLFPGVAAGAPIDFSQFARAIAEFEFTLVRADAPLDRFARGDRQAMTASQKRGALLFFTSSCVECHAVAGKANEMFSDFAFHVAGIPQIAPDFGAGRGNVIFDGDTEAEDFGLAQSTLNPADRYQFRTSPLRNLALQATFFHNGAYTRLDDAVEHHLDTIASLREYDAEAAGVAPDLRARQGPAEPVLAALDPRLRTPLHLRSEAFSDLIAFLRDGLLDPDASTAAFCALAPATLPSGRPPLRFEGCPR